MASSTVEDYLKCILRLDEDPDTAISVGAIAEALAVTPGTVSAMMRHLAGESLIEYVPRRSVSLLPEGREQALKVVRRHRLIETFLVQVMKLDWSEVHEEAEVLEHAISDRLLDRMDEMLGHPSHDPHGDPIPDQAGRVTQSSRLQPLSESSQGRMRIVRVDDTDTDFLNWLREREFLPGREIEVVDRDPTGGVLRIRPTSRRAATNLSESAAARIMVEAL